MENNQIFINSGTEYKKMTLELLEAADLAGEIGNRDARVCIKPNLVIAARPENGATTHVEIVDGVLTYLQEKGFTNLLVAEGSWVGDRTSAAIRVTGLDKVCETHGVPFRDLQKDGVQKRKAQGMELSLCNTLCETDYLINLPVLKGHCQTNMTCALKNAKGLIPNSEKRRFHTMGLHRPIALLNTCLPRQMIVVDNICGDLDFEEGGNPVTMNRILCAKDPVLCDAFACRTLGLSTDDVAYIRLAEQLGVGSSDLSKADIRCLNDASIGGAAFPMTRRIQRLACYAQAEDACSACYGMLIHALDKLERSGRLRNKTERICIGQGFRGKTGEYGVGTCTAGCRHTVPGCPPSTDQILAFLENEWL